VSPKQHRSYSRTLPIGRAEAIWARKILGRKKAIKKYPIGQTINDWQVRFLDGYKIVLELRNEDARPSLYYTLVRNGEPLYEVEDHLRSFGGEYSMYLEDDTEFTMKIRED
jgi:hypothetical protein